MPSSLEEIVRIHFIDCLKASNYNMSECARILKISNRTVHNYCEKWGITRRDVDDSKIKGDPIVIAAKNNFDDHSRTKLNKDKVKYFPTNEERLEHADRMLNRDFL